MATIDQLDIGIYIQYAQRTYMIEETKRTYQLDQASSIPPQTQVVDIYARRSEMDLLLGVIPLHAPWAEFLPPKKFRRQRRSPFSFHRIAPSLGSSEKQEADLARLEEIPCETEVEEAEREIIARCFEQMEKLNSMLGFIIGRIGQFLQG